MHRKRHTAFTDKSGGRAGAATRGQTPDRPSQRGAGSSVFQMPGVLRPAVFVAACAALLLSSCAEKTEEEKAEIERQELKITKRQNAIKYYKVLANDFVGHPKSDEAAQRAAALEAANKK